MSDVWERLKKLAKDKRAIGALLTAGLLWAGWEYPKILALLAVLGLPAGAA